MSPDAIQPNSSLTPSDARHDVLSSDVEPNQDDVRWFSAAIQHPTRPEDTNVAERIVNQLASSSQELQNLSDDANRALRKASSSSDPKDVVQANRALSSFYLESLLTTKMISKATQAVEKITSLQ